MGARTNFTFKTETGSLTLYSHWGGDSKAFDLASALNAAMPRIKMEDNAYALRIIVSQLIGPNWDSETGYGLHVGEEGGEEQYYPVTVDLTNGTVTDNDGTHSIFGYISYHLAETVTV